MNKHLDKSGDTTRRQATVAEVLGPTCNSELQHPTHNLITIYRRTCDNACIDSHAGAPEEDFERESIEVLKDTFAKSLRYNLEQLVENGRFTQGQIERVVGPSRKFTHSERVLYKKTHLPAEITFISEMTNRNNEWVNLSPFGWVRHATAPVFTQVSALLAEPQRYRSELLYSEAAFAEEISAIKAAPMGFVLGFAGRSFLVETAFHHITQSRRPLTIYHSSITSCTIRETSDVSVKFIAAISGAGTCVVHLGYDHQTARVSVVPHDD
jgi:hypothetical protein